MPIEVITGQPGNGKTLYLMEDLLREAQKTQEQGRRVLVACGIDGLAPGLVDLELPNARSWNERDAQGNYIVPDGAKIYVDEAWKDFGHLHDARGAPTPKHALDLAEHRHRGLDFVWTTQQPNQLYPFVRGLIGRHSHVSRKFGTSTTEVFEWGELVDDVKSQGMRDKALSKIWVHPKNLFGKYKSATQHTIKSRIPWRVFLVPACVIAFIGLCFWAWHLLQPSTQAANLAGITGQEKAAEGGLPAPAAHASQEIPSSSTPTTAAEWEAALKPAVRGLAFTAPLFRDQLEVNTYPRTLCVIAQQDQGDTCHCYTEQATPIAIADPLCRKIATERYYDPFLPSSSLPASTVGSSSSSSSSPELSQPAS